MTIQRKGCRLILSPARKVVVELLHHARKVPSLPLAQRCDVARLVQARREADVAPSWMAIFIRAFGLLAQKYPELRRAYMPYPWPHLYEHPHCECTVLVERDWQGEAVVLGAKIRAPETTPLATIDAHLRRFRTAPVDEISSFRQLLRLGRLPWIVRRFSFWQSLYLSGAIRGKRFGTCMISSLGNLGIEQVHPLTPLTTYLTFGPISSRGRVTVKLIYDHRVMDGRCVARCLNGFNELLNTVLLDEIHSCCPDQSEAQWMSVK